MALPASIEVTEEHLVDGSEKPFDASTSTRLTRSREHKPNLEIHCDLLDVRRCKVRAVVGVEYLRDAADLPMRVAFSPDALP